ncbi:MAG: hypothetical protein SFT90_00430 [Rickettsiales bacterium]|nr:hypothetical protein [Rickettsiales bacterium]
MRFLRNILNFLVISLIAISATAQSTPPFNPDDPNLPPLQVKWDGSCYAQFGGDNFDNSSPPPTIIKGSEIWDKLCGKYPVNYPNLWPLGSRDFDEPRQKCMQYFEAVKKDMVSPCQYIEAFGVTVKGNDKGDRLEKYWDYHLKGDGYTPPNPPFPSLPDNNDNADGNDECGIFNTKRCIRCNNDGSLKNIQFRLVWEPDCKGYDNDDDGEDDDGDLTSESGCPPCYRNRTNGTGDTSDDDSSIISQGCMPDNSADSWGDVGSNIGGTAGSGGTGGGPKLDIGDFYDFGSSGITNMFIPKCMFDPSPPNVKFNDFNQDKQVQAAGSTPVETMFNRIDSIYGGNYNNENGGKATDRTNQWRGNCGRGKFFYNTLPPKDSNIVSSYPPETSDKIYTSDIWESRTGCFNPEERFVLLPPYGDFNRENVAGVYTSNRIKFFEPNTGGRILTSGSLRNGPPDEVEGGTGDSSYLIPNDRLLMEHPLCTAKVYGETIGASLSTLLGELDGLFSLDNLPNGSNITNDIISKITENYKSGSQPNSAYRTPNGFPMLPAVLQDMMADKRDNSKIEQGYLPMCLNDDIIDDVDAYCIEYLKYVDRMQVGNNANVNAGAEVLRRINGKYNAERYFFNYDNFCWEQKEKPTILPPDPYERWMPLAVRSFENPTDSGSRYQANDRQDIYGNTIKYWATDARRPTFTPYSERHVYDYTEYNESPYRDEDNEYINLSLEEYGYQSRPQSRLDYAYNPLNIYDLPENPEQADLLLDVNKGRKYKLQQCLKFYIEQWAFQGDKGSILLSSKQAGVQLDGNNSKLNSDVSMCQWVAYYDTSQNYDERENFKRLMQLFLTNSLTEGNAVEGGKALALSELIKNDNKNKRGLRPEYFDYMNFLTASNLPVETEETNLTNMVEVPSGEAAQTTPGVDFKRGYFDLYNRFDPTIDPKGLDANNVPSIFRYPERINFAQRDCETIVPPQFWRDTIKPFYEDPNLNPHADGGCHPIYDFRNIIDLPWSFTNRNAIANNDLVDGFFGVIQDSINKIKNSENFHWMTTREDMPAISLVSAVPSLPVFAYGFNIKDGVYFVENWEKFGENEDKDFEIRDTWLARSGGKTAFGYHLVQRSEADKLYFKGARLGLIVLDEKEPFKGREWIDHSFPARNCMHMEPLSLGKLGDFWNDPDKDPENLIHDAWKNWDDIRLDYLALFLKDSSKLEKTNFDKDFGGFKAKNADSNYYKWLPTTYSLGFGMSRNFWCEFETPYFPYLVEKDEFKHAKKQIGGHFKINAMSTIITSFPLKKEYKPKLEYYRVERIRDACGPFGVASTWVDDPNSYISDWLIGKEPYNTFKLKSRCADWYDSYKRKTNDPKIIGWRLPRFDYEFLKAFLECTGPIKEPSQTPPVCKVNTIAKDINDKACDCEISKAVINAIFLALNIAFGTQLEAIECTLSDIEDIKEEFKCDEEPDDCNCDDTSNANDDCKNYCGKCEMWENEGLGDILDTIAPDCITKWCDYDGADPAQLGLQLGNNIVRAIDYCTRGDTEYALDEEDKDTHLGSLEGFDNGTIEEIDGKKIRSFGSENIHSVDTHKFWLKDNGVDLSADDPFGFWCKCPADKLETTRCREDFCTCQQHVFMVGRDLSGVEKITGIKNTGDPKGSGFFQKISNLARPVTTCKWYGPYLRWLQCFYQARAKACPVVTREVSDSIPYDSVYNPFRNDKKENIPSIPEVTQKNVLFNVCTAINPDGTNLNNQPYQILDYLRWSKEEPNHLARLPAWFESAGAGYKHQDFVFQAQTRRWESPFMELAVPFPIDLISRDCSTRDAEGNCEIEENADGESNNNLQEITKRGGLGFPEVRYDIPDDEEDEYNVDYTNQNFKNIFLNKEDRKLIRPTGKTLQNKSYVDLYKRYQAGLYAAHLGFRHNVKPQEPKNPSIKAETSAQDIHPRAQDAIVGPRGCDIGGWYEMMLYQARCIRWWKLNCICDYDKTFAIGNETNYVLKRGGAKINLAIPTFSNASYQRNIMTAIDEGARSIDGRSLKSTQATLVTGLKRDADGKVLLNSNSQEILSISTDLELNIPLADRGVPSPEYGMIDANDHGFIGLDNVMVGDIIVWNENINHKLSSGENIDAGYKRHVAYVEEVSRVENKAFTIKVSEMNWGKNLDSCGNTNRWGRRTERTIVRPYCASNVDPDDCKYGASIQKDGLLQQVGIPQLSSTAGSVNLFASCQNADWAVCVEKAWDQVQVYRPYKLTHTIENGVVNFAVDYDYFYTNQTPPANANLCPNGYPKPITYDRLNNIANGVETADITIALPFDDETKNLKKDGKIILSEVKKYIEKTYNVNEIIESNLWKFLVSTNGKNYAIDEVKACLFNAQNAGGYYGRYDPPFKMTRNYEAIIKDYCEKNNLDCSKKIIP